MSALYLDFDILAASDPSGGIQLKTGLEAFYAALTCWLTSMPNDFIRNPTQGGVLARHIQKPLSNDTADKIKLDLSSGLINDFSPSVTVYQLSVLPDYDTDSWYILIVGYVPQLKELVSYEQYFRRPV